MNQAEIQELINNISESIQDFLDELDTILEPMEQLEDSIGEIIDFKEENNMEFETDFDELKLNALCSLVRNSDEYEDIITKFEKTISELENLRDNLVLVDEVIDRKIINPLYSIKANLEDLESCEDEKGIEEEFKKSIKKLEKIEV